MKLSSRELKRRARTTLNRRYGLPMLAFVLTQAIVLLFNIPFQPSFAEPLHTFQIVIFLLASAIISLLSILLHAGQVYMHLQLARGNSIQITDLFHFLNRRPDRFLLSGLLLALLFTAASLPAAGCCILAIFSASVPAYILAAAVCLITLILLGALALSYDLVYCLLIDRPNLRVPEAFRESRRLMKGHRARKLYISASFLGFSLLSMLSLGIGMLWVMPYITQTNAAFYRNVVSEI